MIVNTSLHRWDKEGEISPEKHFFLLAELDHGLNKKKKTKVKEPQKWPWKKGEDSSSDISVWAPVKRRDKTKV